MQAATHPPEPVELAGGYGEGERSVPEAGGDGLTVTGQRHRHLALQAVAALATHEDELAPARVDGLDLSTVAVGA